MPPSRCSATKRGAVCDNATGCQLFADAAESFVAEWRISNRTFVRTVFSGSDDIVSLFMKNIDPPEFD
jgi:hypothetical protein